MARNRSSSRAAHLLFVTILTLLSMAPRAFAAFGDITLVGHLTLPGAPRVTNVWGYYDYKTHKEYALVGDDKGGFFIVNVTDPSNPVLVTKVTGVPGRDIKPFGHYAYACNGSGSGVESRIIDIANPALPIVSPNKFRSSHTITISSRGHLYAQYVGVTIYDIVVNPTQPDSLYKINNFGHDSTWRHNVLYDFNWNTLNIWNVVNPAAPVLLGSNDDPTIQSYHSGDESKDGHYLYVCDELAITPTPDIVIFNISNPASPQRVNYINDGTSRVHQLYVVGNLMFVGYYTSGFKVFDITNPALPVLADAYDTSPYQSETDADVYNGAWNAYPFAPSGIVYVSDHPTGLYLFSVEGFTGTITAVDDRKTAAFTLSQNHPNPFNPSTTISFLLNGRAHARLSIYDVNGQRVATLVDRDLPAGAHQVAWDGTDARGARVASGVYYYRLDAGGQTATKQMVLLK
ncbi:MAG TPA: choice-of-anchor B family protein [Candidatus Krumholzibacteria bacterium]|nr:choice-of-anchor B family protein [Candidatus Krumholzibacteria bacterium]